MAQGYLAIVLHAHLPYVRHPEYPEFLEEDWFYQAITETYVPILHAFERLLADGVPFKITMSLTPTLLSMFADPMLQERYVRHLDRSLELADKEIRRNQHDPAFLHLAHMYQERLAAARHTFCDVNGRNLANAFRRIAQTGNLEIVTCGATHGFLPLMNICPQAVRAQVQVAVRTHERLLGMRPRGIWLPECAYTPGIEDYLKEEGIRFFFVDNHGVLNATPRPRYGAFAPVACSNGVAAFARDIETSKQVWSAHEGYPGDFDYRDFYRDAGFDLDYEYIRPHIASTGDRKMTGFKYYRITGDTDHKEPYRPEVARERAADHAANFMFNREQQIEHLSGSLGCEPVVVSMYDAELFGHWWYEGPMWLEFLIRKTAYDQKVFELTTPMEVLQRNPVCQRVTPAASSWGYKGFYEYWLNGKNDWVYRHLHQAAFEMVDLAQRFQSPSDLERRALNQAGRELLLAQDSDWAFIMTAETMVEYAVKRTKVHLNRFHELKAGLENGNLDEARLREMEERDNLFPDLDYRVYS